MPYFSPTILRSLWRLALPTIGLNLLTVLSLAIDTAMCGRLEDAEVVLTGLGFATQCLFLVYIAMIGLSVGAVALVSRAHGGGLRERVNGLLWQCTLLTVATSVAVAVVGNLLARPILQSLGADGIVLENALAYFRPLVSTCVLSYLTVLFGAVLRGVGNTLLPFLSGLLACGLNVLINYALILGHWGFPSLGLMGAAIGTIISTAVGLGLLTYFLVTGREENLRLRFGALRMDPIEVRRLWSIGAPAALDMVILNASFLSIVGMLGMVETVAVAAHGIGLRLQSLAFVPGLAVSQASAALVGQALGGDDVQTAKEVLRATLVSTVGVMTTLGLGILLGSHAIIEAFDVAAGTRLFVLTDEWIKLLGIAMPIFGLYIGYLGLLQGAGATKISLRINALSTLVFQIPLSAFLGFVMGWGCLGIWMAFPIAWVLKAILVTRAYRSDTWARPGAAFSQE